MLTPLPLGINPLGTKAPTGYLDPAVSHPEYFAEAKEAGLAGRAEWCQLPASSPISVIPKGRKT